jgi:hypothetical protein
MNKFLMFHDILFTKCCQITAIVALLHCIIVEFEQSIIFCNPRLLTPDREFKKFKQQKVKLSTKNLIFGKKFP